MCKSMMSLRMMVDRKETGPSLSMLHHIKISSWHQHWKCKVPTQGLRGCGGTRVRTKFSFSQGLTVNLPAPPIPGIATRGRGLPYPSLYPSLRNRLSSMTGQFRAQSPPSCLNSEQSSQLQSPHSINSSCCGIYFSAQLPLCLTLLAVSPHSGISKSTPVC